ncbi:WD repeat-containing protein WDS homolog [Linum perenne]
MENLCTTIGPKGLIRRHELVTLIIQSLYSLGYRKSASTLELESCICRISPQLELLESQILMGNWDASIEIINSIEELAEEARSSALFLLLKQRLSECLNCGNISLALHVLQNRVPGLIDSRERVRMLACSMICVKENGMDNKDKILDEMKKLFPPPIVLSEGRLEHLVEKAVRSQIDSCKYHNSDEGVSLYEDHCCSRDQIPTVTVQILREHKNEVWYVQFSNNGEYLASSSSDCTAIVWKVMEDGKLAFKHMLSSHRKPVSLVAWSPDDTKLLTCGNAEVLKLWDVETGTCLRTFGDPGLIVSSCAWFPDSRRLVCGSSDPEKGIFMWDCDGKELSAWKGKRMPKVSDLAVTPDGEHLIVVSDKEIRKFNVKTFAEQLIVEANSITSLSVSINGEYIIVNLNSEEIHLWDAGFKWNKPLRFTGHKQNKYVIRSCFGGLNSSFIASGSEDSQVYIWNQKTLNPIEILHGHQMTVNCVSWNPKRHQMLASASDDCTIRIWGPSQSKEEEEEGRQQPLAI